MTRCRVGRCCTDQTLGETTLPTVLCNALAFRTIQFNHPVENIDAHPDQRASNVDNIVARGRRILHVPRAPIPIRKSTPPWKLVIAAREYLCPLRWSAPQQAGTNDRNGNRVETVEAGYPPFAKSVECFCRHSCIRPAPAPCTFTSGRGDSGYRISNFRPS